MNEPLPEFSLETLEMLCESYDKGRVMRWLVVWVVFIILDVPCWLSVPREIRQANNWSLFPGGGYILAAEYHFGNKLKAPNGL
jgi:hypothetical protein